MSLRFSAALLMLLAICSLLSARAVDSSSLPLLSNEVISTSPGPNSSLDIELTPMCESDDILFKVTQSGQPVAGADVELRHFADGIHFEAETATNSWGRSAFVRRPAGRYDLTARILNVTMGQIFFKIPPCISPPSGVGFRKAAAVSASSPYSTQVFVNGMSREFYDITLPDGRPATRVILRADKVVFEPNQILQEQIPLSVASSERAVGFESDYPQNISLNASLSIFWARGSTQLGQFSRSYVIYRQLDAQMVQRFDSPSLAAAASFALTNTTNQTASAQNAATSTAQASINPWVIFGLITSAVCVGAYVLFKPKKSD